MLTDMSRSSAARRLPWAAIASVLATTVLVAFCGVSSAAASPEPSTTRLVSVGGTPAMAANVPIERSSASADGRFVVFSTAASNLAPVPTGGHLQVYLRDTVAGTTRLLSRAITGQAGDGDSTEPTVSADGTRVAYTSAAKNIAVGTRSGTVQILLWNSTTDTSTLVSLNTDPVPAEADAASSAPIVSGDGRTVVFVSAAHDLTSVDPLGTVQVYSHDVQSGATTLVSRTSAPTPTAAAGGARMPSVSADGRLIAFVAQDQLTAIATGRLPNVYLRDSGAGTTQLVSISVQGTFGAGTGASSPDVSADGRRVAFVSNATNLGRLIETHGADQIWVRDLTAKSTLLVSQTRERAAANHFSSTPRLSPDGATVAFSTRATNLVPGIPSSPNPVPQILRRTLDDGRMVLVSRAVDGQPASDVSFAVGVSIGGVVTFASAATNLTPEASAGLQVYQRSVVEVARVDRLGGADRFAVSAAVSADAFPAGAPIAYIASGAVFADALSGSAAAGALGGPVLLVSKDVIPDPVDAELRRLRPQRIVVLGGVNSVSALVERAMSAYSGDVSRIAGADRYEVSAALARSVAWNVGAGGEVSPPIAYVASGEVFPDALSGSAAASRHGPMLLVSRDTVPASVAEALGMLAPTEIVVLGGKNSISDAVLLELGGIAKTSRIDGTDRFEVSATVSAKNYAPPRPTVYVASGAVFPDALSGAAAAARADGPVLLITADAIPVPVAAELERLDPVRIVVLGGPRTVSDAVLTALARYATSPS